MAKRKQKEILPPKFPFTIREYEASPYWTRKSKEILDNKECKCALCGRERWKWLTRKQIWKRVLRFAVHHIRYDRVPYEAPTDFLVICQNCHSLSHSLFQWRNISPMYEELAQVVEKYGFKYDSKSKDAFYVKNQS